MDWLLLLWHVLALLNMWWAVVLVIAVSTLSSHWLRLLNRCLEWVIPGNEFFVFLLLPLEFVILLLHDRIAFSLAWTFPWVIDNWTIIMAIIFTTPCWKGRSRSFLALIINLLIRVHVHFLALFWVLLLWGVLGNASKFARCSHSLVETKTVAVFVGWLLGGDLNFCHWIWNALIMSIACLPLTRWKIELLLVITIPINTSPVVPCRITFRLFSPHHDYLIEASFRIDLCDALALIRGAKLWQTVIVLSLHQHTTIILAAKVLSRWLFIQQLLVSVRVYDLLELSLFSLKLFQLVHIFNKLLALMISFWRSVSISIKLLLMRLIVMLAINFSDSFKFKLVWVLENQCFLSSRVLYHVNTSWDRLLQCISCLMVLVVCFLHVSGTTGLFRRFLSLHINTPVRGLYSGSNTIMIVSISACGLHEHWTEHFLRWWHLEKCLRCACHLRAERFLVDYMRHHRLVLLLLSSTGLLLTTSWVLIWMEMMGLRGWRRIPVGKSGLDVVMEAWGRETLVG